MAIIENYEGWQTALHMYKRVYNQTHITARGERYTLPTTKNKHIKACECGGSTSSAMISRLTLRYIYIYGTSAMFGQFVSICQTHKI